MSKYSKKRIILFRHRALVPVAVFGALGLLLLAGINAVTNSASIEVEESALEGNAVVVEDTSASNDNAVNFNNPGSSPSSNFETLPVGADLPTDSECANLVDSFSEVRNMNVSYNNTTGTQPNGRYPRVTGNFTGTTEEIIEWGACKWGIDEDHLKAQVAKESYWDQTAAGDRTSDTNACIPGMRTPGSDGLCPESIGVMQVRYLYHQEAFVDNNSVKSTAYNLDYALAVWRDCYEGNLTWLNNVERGADYEAGDEWGCMGVWFTGRWYVPAAYTYIDAVKDYLNQRIWETQSFINYGN